MINFAQAIPEGKALQFLGLLLRGVLRGAKVDGEGHRALPANVLLLQHRPGFNQENEHGGAQLTDCDNIEEWMVMMIK